MNTRKRFFERIKGNKEEYWIVYRDDKKVFQSKGNLRDYSPGNEIYSVVTQEKWTYVEAETKLDQLILQKIKQGFVPVLQFSEPSDFLDFSAVRLISLDETHQISLSEDTMNHFCNWMIDKQWLDKSVESIDLTRWSRRAMRKAGIKNEIESDEDFDKYMECWLQMSFHDRSQSTGEESVAAFKFNSDYWIINPEECAFLAAQILEYEKKQGNPSNSLGDADTSALEGEDSTDDENSDVETKKISSRKVEQYRFFNFIKNCAKVGFTVRKAHVCFKTVKKNVSSFFNESGDAQAPYMNLDEDSFIEIVEMLRENNVLIEYDDDDIRYGEYDLADIDMGDLGQNDAEFIERLLSMSTKKDEVLNTLTEKGISSEQAQFAEKFATEWRKKTKKIRQSSLDDGSKIPEYKLSDTNLWIINKDECNVLQNTIPKEGSLFDELQTFIQLANQKDGIVVEFLD